MQKYMGCLLPSSFAPKLRNTENPLSLPNALVPNGRTGSSHQPRPAQLVTITKPAARIMPGAV